MTAFRRVPTLRPAVWRRFGLIAHHHKPHAAIVLVTVNAMLQKVAPQDVIESLGFLRSARQSGTHG